MQQATQTSQDMLTLKLKNTSFVNIQNMNTENLLSLHNKIQDELFMRALTGGLFKLKEYKFNELDNLKLIIELELNYRA